MWWQILPSMALTVGVLCVPHYYNLLSNQLVLGVPHKRRITYEMDSVLYFRDRRISGQANPYHQLGLDSFNPDSEQENTNK